ncbi:DUF4157 domain-containing protein [Actinophytocola oryzae]|uniref:eCIS core domain-containing protein n=1 Tax=Actinophytocola oryzae TaxID=502181 RepID=UPI0010632667|nr:DUF4157 domain-containing protein [Actinophytocola oryzae]
MTEGRLVLGAPDDPSEHEAHHAAHRVVVGGAARVLPVEREVRGTEFVDPDVQRRIAMACRHGSRLSDVDRVPLERAFGADLGAVRLHTGAESSDLCRALDAHAFTVGDHVFLGDDYRPGTEEARELLAHELAHVLQRETGVVRRVVYRMGVGQRVVEMTEEQVLERVSGYEDGELYTAATGVSLDLVGWISHFVTGERRWPLSDVYAEIRRLVDDAQFQEDMPMGISGVRLQYKEHGAEGTDQSFAAVESGDGQSLDVHPARIIFRASVAAKLGVDDGGESQVGKWTLGLVQTVLSSDRSLRFGRPDGSARTVTMTLASAHNDRREDDEVPWYDKLQSRYALDADYQVADVLLDDQPGFRVTKHAAEVLDEMSGTDVFRTWLILRGDSDASIAWLYYWDWQIDYSVDGGTVSLTDEGWYPDGSGAVLDGPRASQSIVPVFTDIPAPSGEQQPDDSWCPSCTCVIV